MFEWFFAPYARILLGVEFLLVVPGTCAAPVDVLRALTLLLGAAAGARMAAHWVADRRLRRGSPTYDAHAFAELYALYRDAGARVGVTRLPPLHRHADRGPLAFTTGCFRPAIFLAPALVRTLAPEELRAVLVHELVHVRRRDNLRALVGGLLPVGALAVLLQIAALYALFVGLEVRLDFVYAGAIVAAVLALLWTFRTVVWPRVVFRRELSCDDRVVEALQNPLVVAASLVQVWRLQRALPARAEARWVHAHPLVRSRPSVEERVRRLIDYRPHPRRAWRAVARRVLVAAALLWTSGFLRSYHGTYDGPGPRVELPASAHDFFRPRREERR